MLLLKKKTFEVSADSPLVKADDAAALARAEEIIAAAEAEADAVRAEAKAAYEAEKRRGYDDGIANGREEILLQKLDLLDESVAFMESVEGKMAEIVTKAIRKCVAEIEKPELVTQIVRKAMAALVRNQRHVTVRVAPEMVASVRERFRNVRETYPSVTDFEVAEDVRLSGASAVVETEAGLVEASVDRQLDAIEKSIRKSFEKGR